MKHSARTIILSTAFVCLFAPMTPSIQIHKIGNRLEVIQDAVNGVRLHRNEKTLAIYGDPRQNADPVDTVLFTHHRRDVVWAGRALVLNGARAVVPREEEALFTRVESFWEEFRTTRFHDYDQQSTKILTKSLPVSKTVAEGEALTWEGLPIQVLRTPGYTRGAVTYFLEHEGQRIAFTGDLIHSDGRVFDIYSLQDAIEDAKIRGYHGYAARAHDAIDSLLRIRDRNPDIIIPARGPIIRKPRETIDRLVQRIRAAYTNYLSIDALHWYFGDEHMQRKADRVLGTGVQPELIPFAETVNKELPPWLTSFGTSRLILAEDGSGFLVDCGSANALEKVKQLTRAGQLKSLDGIHITHYHDDHVDYVAALVEEYGCPVYACMEMEDLLEKPAAYRLPAMTATPIRDVKGMPEGAKLSWKEFDLTFSHFPGQTLYHSGLLVEKRDAETIFFIGDSFTPSGIDDYCLLNRNFLHPNTGFRYCLDVLERMKPTYLLINEHVGETFRFSEAQLTQMQTTLQRRVERLRELFPWDDPNYGLDESWARFYPYGQHVQPGQTFELTLRLMNHSPQSRTFRVTLRGPDGWRIKATQEVTVGARKEGSATFEIAPPKEAKPGLSVLTADLQSDGIDLREWTEAMVVVDSE